MKIIIFAVKNHQFTAMVYVLCLTVLLMETSTLLFGGAPIPFFNFFMGGVSLFNFNATLYNMKKTDNFMKITLRWAGALLGRARV